MIKIAKQMLTETREKMRGGNGCVNIMHYFNKDEFTVSVRLCAKLTLLPGTSIGKHTHEKEAEIFIVLSGTAEVTDGEVTQIISAGDATLTNPGESHSITAIGDKPVEIVAIIICQ